MASEALRLEVLHRLPCRLRLGVRPASATALDALLGEARRLDSVAAEAGASGRNVVLRFDPERLGERTLLMRLALALSSAFDYRPVRLVTRRPRGELDRASLAAGAANVVASLASVASPAGLLAAATGWGAALLTLASVGRSLTADLSRGKPRPEGLSLLHLLNRLDSPGRAHGALLTWLIYNGKPLADRLRGAAARGVEVQPVALRRAVGDDREGHHMEIVTRPVRDRGANEGALLTPATLASAMVGYLVYLLKQGGPGKG